MVPEEFSLTVVTHRTVRQMSREILSASGIAGLKTPSLSRTASRLDDPRR
jgi:hypothetical protein